MVEVGTLSKYIVNEYERAWDRMGLKVNVGKSKVLVIKKGPE